MNVILLRGNGQNKKMIKWKLCEHAICSLVSSELGVLTVNSESPREPATDLYSLYSSPYLRMIHPSLPTSLPTNVGFLSFPLLPQLCPLSRPISPTLTLSLCRFYYKKKKKMHLFLNTYFKNDKYLRQTHSVIVCVCVSEWDKDSITIFLNAHLKMKYWREEQGSTSFSPGIRDAEQWGFPFPIIVISNILQSSANHHTSRNPFPSIVCK